MFLAKYFPHKFDIVYLKKAIVVSTISLIIIGIGMFARLTMLTQKQQVAELQHVIAQGTNNQLQSVASISALQAQLDVFLNEDQVKKNNVLQKEIELLKKAYAIAAKVYEELLSFHEFSPKTSPIDIYFANALTQLSQDQPDLAVKTLATLSASIKKETVKITPVTIPANVVANNTAPTSGFRRQKVTVGEMSYLVDIVAADLNSTKVIVDTASSSTCAKDCPVLPLAAYVSRSGAYAGINGTYFCPDTYPTCQDKKNSFDVLVMNKDKTYFNSDNNVYSTVPAAVFQGNSSRWYAKTQDWGRDTGPDGVIANRPLLVLNGESMFGGNDDVKESARGNRSFLAGHDNMAYMGVVHGASVAETAKVLQTLGVRNAINLDSGGSTALWADGGYKAGPGRNLPNVVLFVRK